MKFLIIYVFILFLLLINTIAANGQNLALQDKAVIEKQADKDYYCPMHPAIVSEKPGKCPKCGMDLEKKNENSQSPIIALLDKPTYEKQTGDYKVQLWILTSAERKNIVNHFRETATDSIIKNRLSDSAFMNMMLKGTHHLIVRVLDENGHEAGDVVQVQIKTPSGKKISNILNALLDYFESSITLNEIGTHKINVIITVNGKTKEAQFSHNVE